jgi:uncharacterized membrane protein YraQ (UPF0718 family)/copper chaperone CopZ
MVILITQFLSNFLKESVNLWLAMAPYLLIGLFIAGILHVFLGTRLVSRHLGKSAFGSIIKATVFGIPLPICSCGVIPVAASLRKEGASKSATLSFLVSTPTTGVDSIMATYSLMGPLFAVFRPIAAFVSGLMIGTLNHFFNKEEDEVSAKTPTAEERLPRGKIAEVFRYGFVELAEDIGKWLLVGVVIGGFLTVAIPRDFILRFLSYPWLHFLIMLVIAIPLYVCATGSIPIAAALIQKGFSPGAALVFLIAGPATNAVTLSFVRSKLGKKAFYLYLTSIVIVSLVAGLVFNLIWSSMGRSMAMIHPHGEQLPFALRIAAGIFLLLIILKGFLKRKEERVAMEHEVGVPDMTCQHCKVTIEKKLGMIPGVKKVAVDLDRKTVGIDGDVSMDAVEEAIREAGYTPKKVSS